MTIISQGRSAADIFRQISEQPELRWISPLLRGPDDRPGDGRVRGRAFADYIAISISPEGEIHLDMPEIIDLEREDGVDPFIGRIRWRMQADGATLQEAFERLAEEVNRYLSGYPYESMEEIARHLMELDRAEP